jgi:hypothetical protein
VAMIERCLFIDVRHDGANRPGGGGCPCRIYVFFLGNQNICSQSRGSSISIFWSLLLVGAKILQIYLCFCTRLSGISKSGAELIFEIAKLVH